MSRSRLPQANWSITVEYDAAEELDGLSLAPPVNIDPNDSPAAGFVGVPQTDFRRENQIYVPIEVRKLGIIDPDLGFGGSIGARCIPFLTILSDDPGGPGAAVQVVAIRDGGNTFTVQRTVADLEGKSGQDLYFADGGIAIPQGSALRIKGFGPARVRVTIEELRGCKTAALISLAQKLQRVC